VDKQYLDEISNFDHGFQQLLFEPLHYPLFASVVSYAFVPSQAPTAAGFRTASYRTIP
jgi:hypothetical protein